MAESKTGANLWALGRRMMPSQRSSNAPIEPSQEQITAEANTDLLTAVQEAENYYKMDSERRFQDATTLEEYRRALMLHHDPRAQHLPQASHHWDNPLHQRQCLAITALPIKNSSKGKPATARKDEYGFLTHVSRYLSLALSQPGMENSTFARRATELCIAQGKLEYDTQNYLQVHRERVALLGSFLSSSYGVDRDSVHRVYGSPNRSMVQFYQGDTDPMAIWIPENQGHSFPFESGRYLINLAKIASGQQHIPHLVHLKRLIDEHNPMEGLNGGHIAVGIHTYRDMVFKEYPTYEEAREVHLGDHLLRAHSIPMKDFATLGEMTVEYNREWAMSAMEWSPLLEN